MTYGNFIAYLRSQVGDNRRRVSVGGAQWIGNGTRTTFQMPKDTFPVYDVAGTYTVKVAGVAKTEVTDYSLDKEAGTLILASAPANGEQVTIDCSAVHMTQASWISTINQVILSMGNDFWKEFVDDASFTTTKGMLSLELNSGQPLAIAVYDFAYRQNGVENWSPVANFANWRYDPDNNIIYVSNMEAFPLTGGLVRIRGLRRYALGSAASDQIDVQDAFLTIVEFGSVARYWRHRYKDVIELTTKQATDNTRTPLQELIMLCDRAERDYERERTKLKPQKPARIIPIYKEGAGRP